MADGRFLWVLGLLALACAPEDVETEGAVSEVELMLYGSRLEGSFELQLHLDAAADTARFVGVQGRELVDASGQDVWLGDMVADCEEELPLRVQPGNTTRARFAVNQILPIEVSAATLCGGDASVRVYLSDGIAADDTIAVISKPFRITCD